VAHYNTTIPDTPVQLVLVIKAHPHRLFVRDFVPLTDLNMEMGVIGIATEQIIGIVAKPWSAWNVGERVGTNYV
tara:strand:+ start:214 stop:435 length:222 start_codon:yes stop_codon:yes gene_type:complete